MDRSAIILDSEFFRLFGQDDAVLELKGKPLISHVIDAVSDIVDEVIVVTKTKELQETYVNTLEPNVNFVLAEKATEGPLIGALLGFEAARGKYSLLLASNMPFVSSNVVALFFELCHGRSAVIPRWTDQHIEPLQAVYHTKTASEAARMAIEENLLEVSDMVENLGGIRYISTLVIKELDPELKTFLKVNMPLDLNRAEGLLGKKPKKRSK